MNKLEKPASDFLKKLNLLLSKPKYRFSNITSQDVPQKSGVYAIYDEKEKAVIYIGRTKNLKRRLLRNHKSGNIRGSQFRKALQRYFSLISENQITEYIYKNCSFQFIELENIEEMVRFEHFTTAILAPLLNVKLKQQKN